jgi:hypothetical protein
MEQHKSNFQKLADAWHSPIIARTEISKFTGGAISDSYMANLDCLGLGPTGRFKIGRKVCYPVQSLISFLEERATRCTKKAK